MCPVDSQIVRLHFLILIIVLAACLQKTGGFACNWPPAHAKFACDWRPVEHKLYPRGRKSHINCTRVAASRMQIVPVWPPVSCNMSKIGRNLHTTGGQVGTICMWLAATRVQFICDWRPLDYKTRDKQTRGGEKAIFTSQLYFFSFGKSIYSTMPLIIQLKALGYLVGKCAGTKDDKVTPKR